MAKGLKQEHKQVYVRARVAIEEKRMKAINDPKNHIFIQVDDMDNHKVRMIIMGSSVAFALLLGHLRNNLTCLSGIMFLPLPARMLFNCSELCMIRTIHTSPK